MKSLKYSNLPCALVIGMISYSFVADVDAKRRDTGHRASDVKPEKEMPPTSNNNDGYIAEPEPTYGTGSQDDLASPRLPSGALVASPQVVQTGTHPTLTWDITHPSIVEDYVTVSPPSTIITDKPLCAEIRILGQGVTVGSEQGYAFVPTEAGLSVAGSSYNRIFYDTNDNVDPTKVVWSGSLEQGQSLMFTGRYYYDGSWGRLSKSDDGSQNIRALVNGDTPPKALPGHDAPALESFLRPYIGSNGKVQIGPMDSIVFMELTHTDSQQGEAGYDLQDLVLLVTFKDCEVKQTDVEKEKIWTNNGHGNNIDGVDSSNPGAAPFINLDTDPTIDDEGKGGGALPSE